MHPHRAGFIAIAFLDIVFYILGYRLPHHLSVNQINTLNRLWLRHGHHLARESSYERKCHHSYRIISEMMCMNIDKEDDIERGIDLPSSSSPNINKFPIVQLFYRNELFGEFFCGYNIQDCLNRIQAALSSKHVSGIEPSASSDSILNRENIYSDQQLLDVLKEKIESVVIIKISKIGCEKCIVMDTIFDRIATSNKVTSNVCLLSVDESYIPEYMRSLTFRLSGRVVQGDVNCNTCNNSGMIACTTCDGRGFVMKGDIAGFCSACMGGKKVRCTKCGGKCIKCN